MKVPQQLPDFESKLMVMLMADRADVDGRFDLPSYDDLISELTQECNAAQARLGGDEFLRSGVDNDRIARVVAAYREAEDE